MNPLTRAVLSQAHPASLVLGCGSVLAGLTASVLRGRIELFPALTTLLFAVFLQTSVNLYNGYKLYSGTYAAVADTMTKRRASSSETTLIKVFCDAFGILALTAGLPLFSYVGWIGVAYLAVVFLLLHFTFSGSNPLIRTPWGLLITFLLFGPVGVTGTAFVQDIASPDWKPLASYSLISGLMAVNAHIAVQFAAYKVDIADGKQTLLVTEGQTFARSLYLLCAIIVCVLLIARQCVNEIISPWVGFSLAGLLFASSLWVFFKMKADPMQASKLLMNVTKAQYLLLILTMLGFVCYSVRDVSVYLFQ